MLAKKQQLQKEFHEQTEKKDFTKHLNDQIGDLDQMIFDTQD